ncbi:MAG: response regulator transcription factor, partial [Kordiimonadaceae bacterium]|nr:response regulator transcription factor [Kordiimonadaceae bacterium]
MLDNPAKILIADDHALIREGMVSLLGRIDNIGTVSEAADGKTALSILLSVPIDLAILDIRLPGLTGLDVAREIRSRSMETRLMLMTGDMSETAAMTAIQELSLDAFLFKSNDMRQFENAVKAVLSGDTFFPPELSDPTKQEPLDASVLSARETQVVKLIAEGHTSETASHLLGISPHTVRK